MQLKSTDYVYVLLSCLAGWWQAWCANYGRNSILIPVLLSVPFAVLSYAHAALLSRTGGGGNRADWKRMLVLWAGMPLSLVAGSLTILGETRVMYAAGFGIDNLPFYSLRLVIGEGVACLVWAKCLLVWSRQRGLLVLFAALFAVVLFAYGVSELILRTFHKIFSSS